MKRNYPKDFDFTQIKTESRINRVRQVLDKRQPDFTLILENINDPHNLSAVIRSCDAVGIFEINLLYHGSQLMPVLQDKSSAYSHKWLHINYFDNVEECFASVRANGMKIYSTHLSKDATSLYELNLAEPIALVFGNEHEGVSEKAFCLSDGNFIIPQAGMVQSLNISVAAAVSLFEAYRQRLNAGLYEQSRLDEIRYNETLQTWLQNPTKRKYQK